MEIKTYLNAFLVFRCKTNFLYNILQYFLKCLHKKKKIGPFNKYNFSERFVFIRQFWR